MVNAPPISTNTKNETDLEEYSDDDEEDGVISDIDDSVDANGILIDQQPAYGKSINVKIALQLDKKVVTGGVKHQYLVPEGKILGRYGGNPILNSMIYEVEFPDSQVKDYVENVIPDIMISKVDYEGYSVTLINSIVD